MTNEILDPCLSCKNNNVCRKAKTCQRFSDYVLALETHYKQSKNTIPKKDVIINISPKTQSIEIPKKLVPEFACALSAKLMEHVKNNVSTERGHSLANETIELIQNLFL